MKKGISEFPNTAYWNVLTRNNTAMEEPASLTFKHPRTPTIGERNGQFVSMKHNFNETWDRPLITRTGLKEKRS